jgi:three-Cys-motif partner protein
LLLQTVREAEAQLNIKRDRTQRKVDAQYHFVELDPSNFAHLKYVLESENYGARIGQDIALYPNDFQDVYSSIVSAAKRRKGGERVLFLLDQYAYDDIKMSTIKHVMGALQGAEVILTFNVDSLVSFLTDSEPFHQITRKIGLEQYIDWSGYAALKAQGRWREIIQRQLAYGIWKASGARFMTLFFVTPRGNNP